MRREMFTGSSTISRSGGRRGRAAEHPGVIVGGASGDVVAGGLVESHADDDGSIEGGVGLSVAASIVRRCRPVVIPDEAGIGHAPQSFANAASERSRSGLSPKMINSSAAVWAPTPKPSRRVGDVSVVRRARCWSCIDEGGPDERSQRMAEFGCGGFADKKLVEECPWFEAEPGETIRISHHLYAWYHHSARRFSERVLNQVLIALDFEGCRCPGANEIGPRPTSGDTHPDPA